MARGRAMRARPADRLRVLRGCRPCLRLARNHWPDARRWARPVAQARAWRTRRGRQWSEPGAPAGHSRGWRRASRRRCMGRVARATSKLRSKGCRGPAGDLRTRGGRIPCSIALASGQVTFHAQYGGASKVFRTDKSSVLPGFAGSIVPDARDVPTVRAPGLRTAAGGSTAGGKSGLPRARWWVTPTVREDRESATENKPPDGQLAGDGKGETAR